MTHPTTPGPPLPVLGPKHDQEQIRGVGADDEQDEPDGSRPRLESYENSRIGPSDKGRGHAMTDVDRININPYVARVNIKPLAIGSTQQMAINEELYGFMKEGLQRDVPRAQLEEVLLGTGWPRDQVRGALGAFADVTFPIPVPRPQPYVSAREAFVYLVLFSTLYASAFSLGSLLFELVNRAFPDASTDPARALQASREVIRWSMSWLIVTFPVFALVSRNTARAVRDDPGRRLSKVRRWLTYLTLFVAASILIGDVTSIVYNLLGGEITTRFALKVLTVGAITGSVFAYFHRDLRQGEVSE